MLSVGSRSDMAHSKAYHRKMSERFPNIQHLSFCTVNRFYEHFGFG
jgi:hypothetical protein